MACRCVHVVGGQLPTECMGHEVVLEHEGELDFDLRVKVISSGNRAAVRDEHVVEQRTEVWLVDVHRHLHRSAGESDFVAFDHCAIGDLHIDPRRLDRVCIVERDVGESPGHRVARHSGRACLFVLGSKQRDLFGRQRESHQSLPSFGIAWVS
jgi:hypothetical protein